MERRSALVRANGHDWKVATASYTKCIIVRLS